MPVKLSCPRAIPLQIWFYPPPLKRRAPAGPDLHYVSVIRDNYRRAVWRRADWYQRLVLWLALPTWPIWSVLEALRFSLRLGSRVQGETGKGRAQQFSRLRQVVNKRVVRALGALVDCVDRHQLEL